jgi:hypothetical protein
MMSLRQVFKMVLPMVLMTVAVDVWDGVPEQTVLFIMWLVGIR